MEYCPNRHQRGGLRLDLPQMRILNANVDNILFDDFVFQITVPFASGLGTTGGGDDFAWVDGEPSQIILPDDDEGTVAVFENRANFKVSFKRLNGGSVTSINETPFSIEHSDNLNVTVVPLIGFPPGGGVQTTTDQAGDLFLRVIRTADTGAYPNEGIINIVVDANGQGSTLVEEFRLRILVVQPKQ